MILACCCTELKWLGVCRTGGVHVHRPRIHGQAIHAPTNSTYLPFPPLSPLLQRDRPPTRADGILFFPFLFVRSLAKVALAVVSSGVIIATLSRPRAGPAPPATMNHTSTSGASAAAAHTDSDALRGTYALGIAMLVASLICTGVHGALQERTYNKYGPHWREGVFYTVRRLHTRSFNPILLINRKPKKKKIVKK